MATPIRIKRSAVPGKRPTLADLQLGEPAINTYDGRIYLKRDTGVASTVALVTPWTENVGGSIYYNDGNIGVGTTNPTSKLDIVGNSKFTGIVTAGSLSIGSTQVISSGRELQNILSLDAVTIATIESAIINAPNTFTDLLVTGVSTFTNGPVFIGSGTSTGTASQPLQVTGGAYVSDNLGLGVTNPTSKLHINGDTLISGILTVSNGIQGIGIQSAGFNIAVGVITALNFVGAGNSFSYNAGTKTVDINIGGSQWTFVQPGEPTTSSIYRVNGNIGIGTTDPTSKLHVVGDALVTGVSTFFGVTTSISSLFANNFRVSGLSTFSGVTTSTSSLFANNLSVSGLSTFSGVTTSTSSLFANNLSVSGVSTFVNGPVFIGTATSTGTLSQSLQVTGGAYISGSIGIGITNPRENLDVVGTIGIQSASSANRFEIQHNATLNSLDFIFI